MADEYINQELVVSILDKLNDTINEITADVTGQSTKLINNVLEQKKEEGFFDSLSLGDDSVHTVNIADDNVTDSKIKSTYENLITEITSNKTIDTSTGELIDSTDNYVTNFIQTRDGNGKLINDNLYVNKWDSGLLWVGYGNDKTTVVSTGIGGTGFTSFRRKIKGVSNPNIYYIRVVGYYSRCLENELIVTPTEFKSLDWLRLSQENFTTPIGMQSVKNNTARFKENNVIDININTEEETITFIANRNGSIYLNNTNPTVIVKDETQSITLKSSTTYVLVYNPNTTKVELLTYGASLPSCVILAYIYYYNANLVRLALCGNDNAITVYKNNIQQYDMLVGLLPMENSQETTTRIKEINVFDITIADGIMTLTAKRHGSAYINHKEKTICSKGDTLEVNPLTKNATYVLMYSMENNALKLIKHTDITEKCVILAYIYYYNANLVRLALCGNDNSISVFNNGVQVYDMQTEQSIFNHSANSKSDVWNDWTTATGKVGGGLTSLDKITAPVPFVFNSSIYSNNGMLVAKSGDTNTWNSYDNFLGGHMVQLFSKDKSYRGTLILDDRIDTLPVLAIQSWITYGSGHMAFGWVHLGADSAGRIDEVAIGKDTGVYFNPKVTINNTPTVMKAQEFITNMPMQYELNDDGTYKLDDNNQRVYSLGDTIDDKNVVQVNTDNDLYFHSATDNEWHKLNLDTEVNTINEGITTINSTLDTLNSSIETINNSISTINTELDTKDTEISTINETITSLTTEVNTLKTTTETLTSNLATLTSTVSDLSTELEDLKTLVGNPTENHKSNNITYDNSVSGLTATDVYSAINELKTMIDNLSTTP